jgi:hypothetical protein
MKLLRRSRFIQLKLICAGALALAALTASAHAAQAPRTCPGTFTVLHKDRVGSMPVPRGAYSVRVMGVSCSSASGLIGRFLDDFDGVLPGGWTAARSGVGFANQGNGATIALGKPARHGAGGRCPGTFAVEHNDRIGPLSLPAGPYVIRTSHMSCSTASRQLATFLFRDFAGRLPVGWRLNVAAQRFSHSGASFTVHRAGGRNSGGGVHPSLAVTCPGTVTLASGTSIASLVLPAGPYYINVFSDYSCTNATASFKRFAATGALPAQWTLEPQTGTFLLGKQGFQVEPAN